MNGPKDEVLQVIEVIDRHWVKCQGVRENRCCVLTSFLSKTFVNILDFRQHRKLSCSPDVTTHFETSKLLLTYFHEFLIIFITFSKGCKVSLFCSNKRLNWADYVYFDLNLELLSCRKTKQRKFHKKSGFVDSGFVKATNPDFHDIF